MNKLGDFVAVDPWPGTLLLNLGDMAAVWSNGRFRNVMCKEAAIRVSIASFLLGPREAAIETLPQLLRSDHLPKYAPITYEDLRKLRQVNNMHGGEVLALLRADP